MLGKGEANLPSSEEKTRRIFLPTAKEKECWGGALKGRGRPPTKKKAVAPTHPRKESFYIQRGKKVNPCRRERKRRFFHYFSSAGRVAPLIFQRKRGNEEGERVPSEGREGVFGSDLREKKNGVPTLS